MRRVPSGLFAVAALACTATGRAPKAPPDGTPTLAVMTYNVNFGLDGDPDGVHAIRAGNADLVLLQETTPRWEARLHADLGDRYPFMRFVRRGGAGGMGVLSRDPFTADVLPETAGWFPAMRVVVDSPLGRVQVLSVHLRPPVSDTGSVVSGYFTTPKVRVAEVAAFSRAIDPELPALVVGDFNEDEAGRAVGFLADRGLRSVLPEFHPSQPTWRWDTSVGRVSSRLDHVLYDERLEPLDARVVPAGNSDHFPIVAVFRRAASGAPSQGR